MGSLRRTDKAPLRAPLITGRITARGIGVVLPAYNEEAVIAETVGACVETLAVIAPDYEIIVVDDGSYDRTRAIADELAASDPHIHVVHNQPNRGYGGALLAGFAVVSKELTFYMDSDGQFDIRDLVKLLELREQGYRAALGYRARRQDSRMRLINAWGWNLLVSWLFGLHVRDIDCAFKLYDTELIRAFDVHSEGAVISTEMLVKLTRMGIPYTEIPVQHLPRLHGKATGAKLRVIVRAFGELLRLRSKLSAWTPAQPLTTGPVEPSRVVRG
ncbi:MAG TPA: glycosyltransferase family 2 protein [Ktedonobacterales bacterium]